MQLLHRRFEEVAQRRPASVAVDGGSQRLTYAELDARANGLAHALVGMGVGPGDLVALCVPRGVQLAVAILGIWKAGAAYVPLDPDYPVERLRTMLEDAEPGWLVSSSEVAVVPSITSGSCALALLDDIGSAVHPPVCRLDPSGDALAYVIFTSGSTGRPKGVMVQHCSVMNLAQQMDTIAYGELAPNARIGLNAALSFDASIQSLTQLLHGRTVVTVPQHVRMDAEAMVAFVADSELDALDCTPSQLQGMVAAGLLSQAGSRLRTLLVGGEAFPVPLWKIMADSAIATFNCYGPTECTVNSTVARVEGNVPYLGSPLAGVTLALRDQQGEPVAEGEPGLLWIGGVQLATGYLRRADLTADRFKMFADGRAYNSGDICRIDGEGRLCYLGRADNQVKLRGHRIELGEIESCIAQAPGIAKAVVAVHGEGHDARLVGYVIPVDAMPSHAALRAFASSQLPEAMIPAAWVCVTAFPLTPSGKLDRAALPAPSRTRPELSSAYVTPSGRVETLVCQIFADVLELDAFGLEDNFFEAGGTSLLAATLVTRLVALLPDVRVIDLFQSPTPASLLMQSRQIKDVPQGVRPVSGQVSHESIAIVGMAARFPGAPGVHAFWQNLLNGVESISRLDPVVGGQGLCHVTARGRMPDAEWFDAEFFGTSAREAELMDPQQRIFLELAWECMERAGEVARRVGVFAGVNNPTYLYHHLLPTPGLADSAGDYQILIGNEKDYVATRVAHKLDLRGPAISVHTACSTSLVAVCQAVQSLRAGECELALAGAVSVICPLDSGYVHVEGGMLSPDGTTRPFDTHAAGTAFGDGAGVVLLKRLSDAVRDGNTIHAVIRGVALNNDGGKKASFTAPSATGQADVVAAAHQDAGVSADDVGYVEAHGTATPLGDPIEIEGLTGAFRRSGKGVGHCLLGSVKGNIGHAVTAAGVAGLIKAVRVVESGRVPPTLHFKAPNPSLQLDGSPFVIAAGGVQQWMHPGTRRFAGVSSFGVGGTNAHVVIESPPQATSHSRSPGPVLLTLSARNRPALQIMARNLAAALPSLGEEALDDVAWTLARGRKPFAERLSVTANDLPSAIAKLALCVGTGTSAVATMPKPSRAAFLFTGQGAQYPRMGLALAERFPVFASALEDCVTRLRTIAGIDLKAALADPDLAALLPTSLMQPATFVFEYALARLWQSTGLAPAAMLGHSLGEFVAATLAGVFSLDDALRLIAERGRLMQAMPPGGMLSVRLPAVALQDELSGDLCIASENGAKLCVVSGPCDQIDALAARLASNDVPQRRLQTSHAFHSSMMVPAAEQLQDLLAKIPLRAPAVPMVSSMTGGWLSEDEARSPAYWAQQAVSPVRFAHALTTLVDGGGLALIEVGPRQTLAAISRSHLGCGVSVIGSGADAVGDEVEGWLSALGQAWCAGLPVDVGTSDTRNVRRLMELPTYPFQRGRHWIEPPGKQARAGRESQSSAAGLAESEVHQPAAAKHESPGGEGIGMTTMDRGEQLGAVADVIRGMVAQVAGCGASDLPGDTPFLELGLDSLVLTQLAAQMQRKFGQRIGFRQLMAELSTIHALAAHLAPSVPADVVPTFPPVPLSTPTSSSINCSGGGAMSSPDTASEMDIPVATVHSVIQQQMALMERHLEMLRALRPDSAASPEQSRSASRNPGESSALTSTASPAGVSTPAESQVRYDAKNAFGAIARIHKARDDVNPQQRQRLQRLIQRYVARTAKSKAYNQEYRGCMADPRVVSGFRPFLKELVYQTVIDRSNGSRLWDIDGNEYIDANNGFGMSLFGWQPAFVLDAVKAQLERGYEIGPQTPLVGETARLLCDLTGHDRAAFCNTGSEAVLGAIRIARTATGRDTLVVFAGSYHGINDEVIVRAARDCSAIPGAPGILQAACGNVVVLEYGKPEALDHLRNIIGDVAAVLVEPVQSRNPELQPVEFLHEVRALTSANGALLIFDEIITGFRSHLGGTQALFGIRADLATYGKVIGGGFPIGAICGKREFMDVLDGGDWRYGDDSEPVVGVTYFAGTFVRHPLAVAATHAALLHLKEAGIALQTQLNERAKAFVARLNAFCESRGAPLRIASFASLWRVRWLEEHPLQDLLFPMMRMRGIHILDNFPCYLTTAHSQEDINAIADAFEQAVVELQESGFVSSPQPLAAQALEAGRPPQPGARLGRDQDGSPAWFVREANGAVRKVG